MDILRPDNSCWHGLLLRLIVALGLLASESEGPLARGRVGLQPLKGCLELGEETGLNQATLQF